LQARRESEAETMRKERVKQAAVLFGLVLPAIGAGAAGERPAREVGPLMEENEAHELGVAVCLAMNEAQFDCKEQFADAMVEAVAANQETTPEDRAYFREGILRGITEHGSGPLDTRRERCSSRVYRFKAGARPDIEADLARIRSCRPERDCKVRVACMKPIFAGNRMEKRGKLPPGEKGEKPQPKKQ